MKALVTGGAGFVGAYLVEKLLAQGNQVVIIDDLSSGSKKKVPAKAKLYSAKIENASEVNEIFAQEKPDVVFHLAAQINAPLSLKEPAFDAQVNIIGSINIFKAAVDCKCKSIIFSSSAAVYGDTKEIPVTENTPCEPIAPYGLSKLTAEKYLWSITKGTQTRPVALRYSNLYGPGQQLTNGEGGVVPILLNAMLKGEKFTINGDGSHTRDFIHVSDVADANIQAATSSATGLFQISSGQETTLAKLVEIAQTASGLKVNLVKGKPRPGDIYRSCLSNAKAKKELNFSPKIKLSDGIKETIFYYKQN